MSEDFIISIFISLFSLIVGLSGWAVFLHQLLTFKPKIRGKILTSIEGKISNGTNRFSTFLVYLYITNLRNHPIDILDYEMEIDFGNGFQKIERAYTLEDIENFHFFLPNGQELKNEEFLQKLIYNKKIPVEFGQLYHGFILFLGNPELHELEAKKYKISCIDAFGKRHEFINSPNEFGNLNRVLELSGIRFPQ